MGLGELEKDFGAGALAKDFPEPPRGVGDKATGPTTPESVQAGIFGAGQPEKPNIAQRVGNAILPPLVLAPAETAITGGGGMLAKHLAPKIPGIAAAGRVATTGLLGGAEAAAQGKSPVGRGLADAGIAAAFEAILSRKIPYTGMSNLSKVAEEVTGRRRQFQRATDAVDAAFDAIKDRLPPPGTKFLYVPALSARRMSADEVRAALKQPDLPGATYDAARKQIHAELLAMDKKAGKARGQNLYTAKDFASQTLKKKFQPPTTPGERLAESAVGVMDSPATRSAVDVAASQDPTGTGIPAGAIPFMMGGEYAGSGLKSLAARLWH